ncbi:MAG: polysaccharide biosynthesis protein [Candidatus Bathyarchaeota archaeon]|nr:polysaccharide biosynthesis protein [Candidatus Bathyarchaeota archaeon]
MKGAKVLVTGGAGSIGSEIVKKALSKGAEEVTIFDVDEIRLFELSKMINDEHLKYFVVDLRDSRSVERAFNQIGKINVVFHTAAMKHVVVCEENPIETTLTNIIGTQNIVDASLQWGVPTSVLISTDKAVDPTNVMGATKFIAERIFLKTAQKCVDQNFSIVRFGNVASSRGSVIPMLIESLLRKKETVITNPDVTRFLMRIQDAVGLIFKSLDISVGGEIFVLKMPSFKLGDLADIIVEYVAPRLGIDSKEAHVKTIGLEKGEKLHETLFREDELEKVVDLDDFYAIIDPKTFPKHKKYLACPNATNLVISSQRAPRMSPSDLKDLVFEYLAAMGI